MKMFKKIMAVVLTGALAVSMLTGCALGDAVAESAMKSELNRLGKTNKIETTYEKGEKANDDKKYDLKTALKKTTDYVKTLDDGTVKPTVAAVEAVKATNAGVADAVAYVYEIPSSAKKASKWTKIAEELNKKLYVGAFKVVNTKGDKATIVINYDTVTVTVQKDSDPTKTVKKDFIVVVAKAAF